MGAIDQAARLPAAGRPGFAWRVLSPVGAVVLAFVVLIAGAGLLSLTPLSDDGLNAVLSFATSLLLLAFGVVLWRRLPPPGRRWATALKHTRGGAVGLGVTFGAGIVIGAGAIILLGQAIDPVVERRLEDVEEIGSVPWQVILMVVALVVLAPLGEELLFRGLLLRALARRFPFWPSALISSVLFASAHADSYILWPRAVSLVGTGLALAWLYRWRGYWASVTAHATVNAVASIALVASS